MEITDKDIAQLEAFWSGSLPDNERMILENRLNTDAEFRKEANKIRLFTEGLSLIKQRQMEQRLKDLDATLPPIEPPDTTNWMKVALVALAIALAAFGVKQIMDGKNKPKPDNKAQAIVDVYFEPYPALGITMGNEKEDIKLKALRIYAAKDYEAAVPLLQQAFEVEKDSFLLFYKSVSCIGDGQSQEAIPLLERMKGSPTFPMDSVDWYLALAYIQSSQTEKAMPLLQKIADTEGGGHKVKAQELINKLKN